MSNVEKEGKILPRATINKLIRETLPETKCTNETQTLILQCCMEFLQLLSSEANEICNKQNKKMISPEHIIASLSKLGFEEYVTEVKQVWEDHKKSEAQKPNTNRLKQSGLSHEELLKAQQELFAKAKKALQQQQQVPPQQTLPTNPPEQ